MPASGAADPIEAILASEDLMPVRLGETVLARLSRAIVEGRLKPGDPLPSEGQIAASFGVSKQVAREAIRELVAMGVVHVQQGKISRVRAVGGEPLARFYRFAVAGTEAGLVEAVELRRILEPSVARLAARRRTQADLAALDEILARMADALGDAPRWIEADLAFHAEIARMARNRLIALQMEGLTPVIREVMERFNERTPRGLDDWRETLQRHVRVAEALRAGDEDDAMIAMAAHFAAAEQAIERLHGRHGRREPSGARR